MGWGKGLPLSGFISSHKVLMLLLGGCKYLGLLLSWGHYFENFTAHSCKLLGLFFFVFWGCYFHGVITLKTLQCIETHLKVVNIV